MRLIESEDRLRHYLTPDTENEVMFMTDESTTLRRLLRDYSRRIGESSLAKAIFLKRVDNLFIAYMKRRNRKIQKQVESIFPDELFEINN